jgi:hypothetical protein
MISRGDQEQFIGTVDVWQLRQMRWPIMRFLARSFVERLELERYMRQLLADQHWSSVRAEPHLDAAAPRPHVYEVYGRSRMLDG